MRSISEAFKRMMNSESTSELPIVLLTISNENFTDDIRVSSDPTQLLPTAGVRGTVSNGLEFLFCNFDIILPGQNDSGTSRAVLSVDNVDRRITQSIREARSQVFVKIQIVSSIDVDLIEIEQDHYELTKTNYDSFVVSGELSVEYYGNEPFPWARITPTTAPGAF